MPARDISNQLVVFGRRNCREFSDLLKTLNFNDPSSQDVTFWFKNSGAKLYNNDRHSNQIEIYLMHDSFEKYELKADDIAVSVRLQSVLDCLFVLDGATSCFEIHYEAVGAPLKIYTEDDGVVLEATIPTTEVNLDLVHDATKITIKFSPDRIVFCGIIGDMGESYTEFPRGSDELESYTCDDHGAFSYTPKILKRLIPSLAITTGAQLKIDERGNLSVRSQVHLVDAPEKPFVDFKCVPMTVYDDDPE
ncbi:unnamed protein product, partial [Mesorhabditis spiculigera]